MRNELKIYKIKSVIYTAMSEKTQSVGEEREIMGDGEVANCVSGSQKR